MKRHRSLPVLCLAAGFAATSFGLIALSQGASAHTPSISASCSGVVLNATAYDGSKPNQWSVTIDGATTAGTFPATLNQTFAVPQDRVFNWSGRIAAFDGAFEQVRSGTIGPCVAPTAPPTTTPPTTAPPTTTPPPPTAPPTDEPTAAPPTDEPCEEVTDGPTTGGPTDGPTTGEPCDQPPATEEPTTGTESPPTQNPTTPGPTAVLGDNGTNNDDDSDNGADNDADNGVIGTDGGASDEQADNGPAQTLPDTGAPVSATPQVDEGMVPTNLARGSLMGGLLLLLVSAAQLWRRESV